MSKLVILLGLAILSASLYYLSSKQIEEEHTQVSFELVNIFKRWKLDHGRIYGALEDSYRLEVFVENLRIIQAHNVEVNKNYTLGSNKFMDLTDEEFISFYLNEEPDEEDEQITYQPSSVQINESDSVDWRKFVFVKDQGKCGSCWAFGAIGAAEAYFRFVKGESVMLSEQHLVDCSSLDHGCDGGLARRGLDYIAANGVTTADIYPYNAIQDTCQNQTNLIYKINGRQAINGTTEALKDALRNYPLSVGIDAKNWKFYKEGVFDNCGNKTNHAVIAVGFEAEGNWIVKNSWGNDWGEEGFIRLAPGNTCNIFKKPTQAI